MELRCSNCEKFKPNNEFDVFMAQFIQCQECTERYDAAFYTLNPAQVEYQRWKVSLLEKEIEQAQEEIAELESRLAKACSYIDKLESGMTDVFALRHEIEKLKREREKRACLPQAKSQKRGKPKKPRNTAGFVYLVRSIHGLYKIGKSKIVESRMRRFEIKLPFPVSVSHFFPCDDYHIAEQFLHDTFADKRMDGEWFKLELEDVAWLKSIEHDSQLYGYEE